MLNIKYNGLRKKLFALFSFLLCLFEFSIKNLICLLKKLSNIPSINKGEKAFFTSLEIPL